jgi:hypothetical protein
VLLSLSITTASVLLAIALSVTFALVQARNQAPPPPPQHEAVGPTQPFQDTQGRYRLSIPSGWEVSLAGDDPTFHNGPSWIKVRIVTAASASAAVDQVADLFRSQFTTFNTINRGNTTIAGRASHGLNLDVMTAAGQRMSVLLTAQPQGGKQYFVLVSATPVARAPELNTSVMALANSVRFSGE